MGCLYHRDQQRLPDNADRRAISTALNALFDLERGHCQIDIITLINAVYASDRRQMSALLRPVLPSVDWVRFDDAVIGSDWGGVKVAASCTISHPQLQAAIRLMINASKIELVIDRIERVGGALAYQFAKRGRRKLPFDRYRVKIFEYVR